MKDEKLTPRIGKTARSIWVIYLVLILLCTVALWLTGMSLFDAVGHSFSILSTAGFSTHDASLAYYNSPAIEIVAIIFMILGAINFNVHFLVLHGQGPMTYWRDPQTKVFLLVVAALAAAVSLFLYAGRQYPDLLQSLRYGTFQLVSVITTTGLTTADFSVWPMGTPLLIMLSSFIAGCAGSTSGGIKVIRFMVLAKVGYRELSRLIHPHMVRPIKISGRVLPKPVLDAVWSFFSVYVAIFIVLMLLVMATGIDQVTAFGAVASCLNNVGPGLGDVAITFHDVDPVAKWLCTLAMLLGRLEIFTVLVLFSPVYWRK
jgi:trk system potassium uptake protein TrkH